MPRLDDLSDDCLMEVLDRVSPEELFQLQRLNKRMKRLATIKIGVKIKAISLFVGLSSDTFFKCTHLDTIRPDQVLNVIEMMELLKLDTQFVWDMVLANGEPMPANGSDFLLDVFSKCINVKRINFELPGDLLLQVFQRCPEIEFIKLGMPLIKEVDWNRVLDLFGHRLVHVWNGFNGPSTKEAWLLAMVAEKCPNIKQIDWLVENELTRDWMTAIKRLPKSCRVNIKCYSINDGVFEDVIDELEVVALPTVFIDRTERLLSLRLCVSSFIINQDVGTEFVNLKKLEISSSYADNFCKDFVLASQFPRLEEFDFIACWDEDDYETMFARMTTVKRLTLIFESYLSFPQKAIRRLKKLETITFVIKYVSMTDMFLDNQEQLLQHLEQYIEDVNSLKKMVIEPNLYSRDKDKWQQSFRNGIEKLNEKSRVAVEFKL